MCITDYTCISSYWLRPFLLLFLNRVILCNIVFLCIPWIINITNRMWIKITQVVFLNGTWNHQNVTFFQWMTFYCFIINYYSLWVPKRRRVRHSVVVTTFIISLYIKESVYFNGMNKTYSNSANYIIVRLD